MNVALSSSQTRLRPFLFGQLPDPPARSAALAVSKPKARREASAARSTADLVRDNSFIYRIYAKSPGVGGSTFLNPCEKASEELADSEGLNVAPCLQAGILLCAARSGVPSPRPLASEIMSGGKL